MPKPSPTKGVFLNVPFDPDYQPLFEALVFVVAECGFFPRCALEAADAGEVRVEKIARIIRECALGIHDISRTEPDAKLGLPRFNMPFELGLFLGARWFGDEAQRRKNTLILDRDRFRYQQFISDIAGQDIKAHGQQPEALISAVRHWLRDANPEGALPGATKIIARYQRFRTERLGFAQVMGWDLSEFQFNDHMWLVWRWLEANELLAP